MRHNYFNLNQIKSNPDGQPTVKANVVPRYLKNLAMIFAVLTLSIANIGMAWAWDECYYVDGNVGWTSTNVPMGTTSSGNGSCFMYMETNHYFKFRIASKPVGESTNKELTTDGIGVRLYRWDSNDPAAAKYTGNSGIVEVHADQATGDNNYNPWIWLTRPTVYVLHKWNNSSWSNQAMTDNNDGTYTYIGQYSGSNQTNVGPCGACSSGGDYFKYFSSATLTGSPAKGDRCLFTYSSSGFRGKGGESSNKGSLRITKLCSITYDGNGKTGGAVPTSQTDIVYNTSTTVSGNVGSLEKTGSVFVGWNTAANGSGTFYFPGGTITPTTSVTLYAQWLTIHEPGLYEKAAGSGGYGQTLVTSEGKQYEVYQYAESSGIYVYAGTSTTSESAANCMLKYASSNGQAIKNWMLHSGSVYNTSSSTSKTAEFQTTTRHLNINESYKHVIAVTGFDQFSIYAKDKTVSSAQVEIYINDVKSTALSSTKETVRRYTLTPSNTYIIRIEATGSGSNVSRDLGFSLRLPPSSCTAPTGLSAGSLTAKGATFTVTDGANTNNYEFYVSKSSTAPTAETEATYTSTAKTKAVTDLVAGTKYYAWVRSKCSASNKSDWVSGGNFTTSTVTVTHTLTNVTETSGAATSGVGGSDYTAVYEAASGYSMPTPTVTIGGNTATSGTDYTWSSGTLTIPANKINGNIVITLNSAAAAPTNVSISGAYHYYPGETISLTAEATGGNGPKTYQWYHGGKADGNMIDGATSATYTKASCVVGDAGDYYCKVTCGGSASRFSDGGSQVAYQVKIMQFYLKNSSGVDISNHALTKVDATHATLNLSLTGGTTYKFRVTDGCNDWYGNSDATGMTSSNCTNWTMPHDADCKVTTNSKTGTYTFNFDFTGGVLGSEMKVSIVYPGGDQAAGKIIYWDNNVLNWEAGKQWYRIGRNGHNNKTQMTLVPGTANLYKITTTEYNGFEYWHIANNDGNGTGNIFWTKGDAAHAITHAMAFEAAPVTDDAITITPTTSHATGETEDNNNCQFYTYGTMNGMKTQNVSITAPSNGTITVNYVDVSGAAQAFSSGNRDLAHTCIITVTAEPAAGYAEPATVSINGASHGNRDPYTITGTTVVAATFSPASYTVTLNTNSGTINAGNVTSYTYGTGATLPTNVTKDGFTFDGWYDNSGLTGSAVTTISTTATGNKEYWAKWTEDAGSSKCITFNSTSAPSVSGVTIKNVAGKSGGSTYTENGFFMSQSGDYITFDISALGNLTKATFTAKTNSDSKKIGYGYTDNATYVGEVPSEGTADTQFHEYEITSIPDNTKRFTLVRRGTGTTITEVCLFYTPDVCSDPVINEGLTTSSFAGGTWAQNSGHTITITATGADSYEWYRNTSATDAGATKLSETSNTLDITDVTPGTYYFKAVAKSGACSSSTEWGWSGAMTITASGHTVTYDAQGGSVTPTSETVSTATLPTPTKSGYTFDGWYTSGGSKITGTYNPTADITLYAQWQSTDCDAGGTTTLVDINFKDAIWSDKTFEQGNTNDEDVINGVYFWCKHATKHFSLEDNTSNGLTFPDDNMSSDNRYFCIPITGINSSNKQITVTLKHGYSNAIASFKYYYNDGRTEWVDASAGSGTSVSDAQKSDTEITFTLNNSGKGLTNTAGHLFIGRSSSSYPNIYGVKVTTPGAAGTCYYVTYNGNGATGGYTTDETAYASGDNATAATNSFTKTGYTFKEWRTNANGTGTKYEAGDPIAISGNITLYAIWQAAGYTLAWNTNGGSALAGDYSSGSFADGVAITAPTDPTLSEYTFNSWNTEPDGTGNAYTGTMPAANTIYYAVWGQAVTLDANMANHGSAAGSATAILGRAGLTGITHATPASGYKLTGYYTDATEGTKVLNSDGTFASSNVTDYITSGKWSRTGGAPTLYAQYEASGSLKWNLGVKTTAESLTTSSKESSFTEISTSNMSNATVYGVTYTASSKNNLTGQISTPAAYDAEKYVYVTFKVADGYKFTPSSISVKVQPVGENEHKAVKLSLADATNTLVSGSPTKCDGTSSGKTTTVTLAGDGTYFTGTVTLKIYVYDFSSSATGTYRLGTPIEIQGAIEAACTTMPSFTQMNYSTTTFAPSADASGSPITIVGGENIDTYQWKYNTTNDRTSGTDCGSNVASLVPLTDADAATDGTRYYWCEMTNNACGITIKSPAVAITVRANKSDASVTWTDPANEPNYGGGGYVIRATMNSGYDGTLSAEDLTAPAGIRITNVSIDNEAAQKYIEATFDVTTAFNRDENSKISFTLSHDATTGYEAISDEHEVDYDACSGGEEGSAAIALTSAIHDEGSGNAPRYWFETSGVGRIFGINYGKATLSTSSDATFSTDGYEYVALSTSQRWVFQPYVEGVTKIRIYIKSATNTLKVSSIGKNASWQDQSSKYSNIAVDTVIYSNGKTTGLDNTEKGYAEIQFSSALTKDNYYMFTMSSASTYIYGVTLYSGSVGDGGNLATSLTFANTGPIAADASTANFQNIASKSGENSNTLGTITYSSNNDAATVNATTGEVSIHAKETAQAVTITATLSASGCYQGATATYTINVAADVCEEPSGSIELTSGSATKCSDESVILTMTGFTSGATVEWYNGDTKVNGASGYTIVTSGSTSTLETRNAGTYSAIAKVAGGCASGAGRTNSITISNISVDASATKIVDKWYVKNGRLTPDIALWELEKGTTFTGVSWSPENTTGLNFDIRDGVVYLEGKEPSANETGADIEYTLTLMVTDACGTGHELTEKTITLTHQQNTDKHVLAFVVNGTEKGGFTADGITAAQTTSVGLYNAIAAQFDVQATNIYATDDEKKLKEYYSQYDILCITDYPNTQTKGANSKSYVDAIGSLIDIRPILTMEAFVSKLANWKAKGISGSPKSPTTRQYTMLLQCKDHEIFTGTTLTEVEEGDDKMYRVSMVDNTKEDYATLDATYGAILPHKEKESEKGAGDGEYNYGGKPALQGFTFTEEMSNNDLLPIGLIDDGAGNPLQVGIERQREMSARMMVLGINSYAMERLTADGEKVVINALKYLMKKNAEDIADCSTSFVGGADEEPTNWMNPDNWTGNTVPDKTQKVRILAPCVVPEGESAHVAGVLIAPNDGGTYNGGSTPTTGSLTIAAGGALVVDGKIQAVTAPAYNRPRATSSGDLAVLTDADAQGALIFDNSEGETQATVQMYSPSYWEIMEGTNKKKSYWSYVAIPIQDAYVGEFFYGAVTYLYDETVGWIRKKIGTHLHAFEGIGLSLPEGHTETFYGPLAPTEDRTVTLTKTTSGGNGENLIGNSWTAPIQIANFEASDFGEATPNVMIYSTGRDGTQDGIRENAEYVTATADNDGSVTAGQWVSIPINVPSLDGYDGLKVIPAMQAFQVTTDTETSLTLNYDKLVRDVNIVSDNLTEKQHAPARRSSGAKKSLMSTMRVRVSGVKTRTDVWLLEDDRFSDEFDNGWEAKYVECDDRSAQLYAQSEIGNMSFMAKPDIEGTVLGFAPSKDGNQYLFTFHYVGDDEYYLNDLKLTTATLISAENSYLFTYEEGDTNRFYISRQPLGAPAVATGVDNPREEAKPRKFIYKDKMYILYNGRVFDATGKVVK